MKSFGNVLILGDSYSTFEGYIPEGYDAYYIRNTDQRSDVCSPEQTWWGLLLEETNSKLVLNSSYSGTTICHTGYDHADRSDISFTARLEKLIADGFFKENKIDTVFIFGGTNDFWAGSPLGEFMYSNWQKQDLYSVFPALCYMLDLLRKNAPETKIIKIINTELSEEITEGMVSICERYCIDCVKLFRIDKIQGHPSICGMKKIKDQIIENSEKAQA